MTRSNDPVRLRITVDDSNGDLYQRFAGKTRNGPDATYLMRLGLIYEKHLLNAQVTSVQTDFNVTTAKAAAQLQEANKELSTAKTKSQRQMDGRDLAALTGIGADYFKMTPRGAD